MENLMSDRVTIQIRDGVADVRLSRPQKMNALDPAMMVGLIEAGKKVGADPSVRAVVLSGEGRAFCAGLDFGNFRRMAGDGDSEGSQRTDAALLDPEGESPANFAQRAAFVWQEVPVPVIAAVHGVAFGGGLQVAMGADIRYVAPDARLSVMEVKWGLIPDMSGTQTLRYLLRLDVLKELTFTGRIVQGPELLELGLATHLSETPLEDALALAREIASKSPHAVRAAKRLLNESVQSSLGAGLGLEEEIQRSLIGQPNQVEAVKANLEKRDPKFEDAI
jgi:enoyl-CoA hydratase/carnithine racemase